MKVYAQIILSRDGYIAGVGDDVSWISQKTREQYIRIIHGMGNCIMGRRAYQVVDRLAKAQSSKLKAASTCSLQPSAFDCHITILSHHNYPSQPNRHFTHAKPKNILKLLDEKGYSSTVICGGVETIKLFIDTGLVDRLIVYREDVDVGGGVKFPEELLEGRLCVQDEGGQRIYVNNDTSSHSG